MFTGRELALIENNAKLKETSYSDAMRSLGESLVTGVDEQAYIDWALQAVERSREQYTDEGTQQNYYFFHAFQETVEEILGNTDAEKFRYLWQGTRAQRARAKVNTALASEKVNTALASEAAKRVVVTSDHEEYPQRYAEALRSVKQEQEFLLLVRELEIAHQEDIALGYYDETYQWSFEEVCPQYLKALQIADVLESDEQDSVAFAWVADFEAYVNANRAGGALDFEALKAGYKESQTSLSKLREQMLEGAKRLMAGAGGEGSWLRSEAFSKAKGGHQYLSIDTHEFIYKLIESMGQGYKPDTMFFQFARQLLFQTLKRAQAVSRNSNDGVNDFLYLQFSWTDTDGSNQQTHNEHIDSDTSELMMLQKIDASISKIMGIFYPTVNREIIIGGDQVDTDLDEVHTAEDDPTLYEADPDKAPVDTVSTQVTPEAEHPVPDSDPSGFVDYLRSNLTAIALKADMQRDSIHNVFSEAVNGFCKRFKLPPLLYCPGEGEIVVRLESFAFIKGLNDPFPGIAYDLVNMLINGEYLNKIRKETDFDKASLEVHFRYHNSVGAQQYFDSDSFTVTVKSELDLFKKDDKKGNKKGAIQKYKVEASWKELVARGSKEKEVNKKVDCSVMSGPDLKWQNVLSSSENSLLGYINTKIEAGHDSYHLTVSDLNADSPTAMAELIKKSRKAISDEDELSEKSVQATHLFVQKDAAGRFTAHAEIATYLASEVLGVLNALAPPAQGGTGSPTMYDKDFTKVKRELHSVTYRKAVAHDRTLDTEKMSPEVLDLVRVNTEPDKTAPAGYRVQCLIDLPALFSLFMAQRQIQFSGSGLDKDSRKKLAVLLQKPSPKKGGFPEAALDEDIQFFANQILPSVISFIDSFGADGVEVVLSMNRSSNKIYFRPGLELRDDAEVFCLEATDGPIADNTPVADWLSQKMKQSHVELDEEEIQNKIRPLTMKKGQLDKSSLKHNVVASVQSYTGQVASVQVTDPTPLGDQPVPDHRSTSSSRLSRVSSGARSTASLEFDPQSNTHDEMLAATWRASQSSSSNRSSTGSDSSASRISQDSRSSAAQLSHFFSKPVSSNPLDKIVPKPILFDGLVVFARDALESQQVSRQTVIATDQCSNDSLLAAASFPGKPQLRKQLHGCFIRKCSDDGKDDALYMVPTSPRAAAIRVLGVDNSSRVDIDMGNLLEGMAVKSTSNSSNALIDALSALTTLLPDVPDHETISVSVDNVSAHLKKIVMRNGDIAFPKISGSAPRYARPNNLQDMVRWLNEILQDGLRLVEAPIKPDGGEIVTNAGDNLNIAWDKLSQAVFRTSPEMNQKTNSTIMNSVFKGMLESLAQKAGITVTARPASSLSI